MKVKKTQKSGSLKVDPVVLKETKFICLDKDVNIYDYATEALKEKNKKEKNGTRSHQEAKG